VLHRGAAFVPLDAAFPRARLAGMIEDARIRFVLVDESGARALSGLGEGLRLISCADGPVIDPQPPRPVHEEQLAYVLFTSGSTGRPKGVEISQRATA
jgi:non-ribosomal peptide synthetase component F